MRKIRELLRLKAAGYTHRQIASSLCISLGAVSHHAQRAKGAAMTWETVQDMTDSDVESLLFRDGGRNEPTRRCPIDLPHVHQELRREGVTLQLLWEEYDAANQCDAAGRSPYRYSQFCELYRAWSRRLSPVMRQVHVAGEKAFIDYSGKRLHLTDPSTGEQRPVELFVMVLGASSYTFAEASYSQQLPDFVASVARGLEFFGGVPRILCPDQLKSAVARSDRYDPEINDAFQELASHYNCSVVPARPRKPRDKAKVEAAVLLVQRWILAVLRNRTFFALEQLNEAIAELLDLLNRRPFKKLQGCRLSAFEELERSALQPLPQQKFLLVERHRASVHIDYHVQFRDRLYSVPFQFVGDKVEVRATVNVVEIFRDGERVASHPRSYARPGTAVTVEAHRPPQHAQGKWPPERVLQWAASLGPSLAIVVERTMARFCRPEDAYRACLGLIRLADTYGSVRAEAACKRALLAAGSSVVPHRRHIEAILKKRLDLTPPTSTVPPLVPLLHENIRGGDYYDRKEDLH